MPVAAKPSLSAASPRSPQPAPSLRQFSFTDFQINNPSSPPPGDRLDGEVDRTNKAVADTIDWAAVSLNSDGSLKPQTVGKTQLVPGLFDGIGADVLKRMEPLAQDVRTAAGLALAAAVETDASVLAAGAQNALALDAAERSSSDAQDAAASAAEAAQSALAANTLAVDAGNAARDTAGDVATCQAYADVTYAWAEHMPDPIPPNILAVMGITGDHWSSRWWANYAQQFVENGLGVPGPVGPQGPVGPAGPQGPAGTGSISGLVAGQIPIAASATGLAASANLSGDVTSAPTTLVTTLATVNANVGTFQGLTVDAKGRVTAAASQGYLTGNQTVTLSGDVTGSGNTAIAATIANNAVTTAKIGAAAVTYAKIQNVAANRLLGNSTGSAAAPAEIALPLAVANGGTGSTTAAAALTALGAVAKAGDTMTGQLTVSFNGTGLILNGATGQDAYIEYHNGTTSDWKVGAQGVTNPGEYWVYNIGTSTAAMRINQANVATFAGALDIGGSHTFPLFAVSGGLYTNLLSPDSAGNQQGGIVLGGSSDPETFYRNGSHRFADRSGGTNFAAFTSVGTYNVSGAWITFSDPSLKQDVAPYRRGLDAIVALEPCQFRYRPGTPFAEPGAPSRVLYGLMADQVRPHVPEIVGSTEVEIDGMKREVDTLETGQLIFALINAVKTLEARLAALEAVQ